MKNKKIEDYFIKHAPLPFILSASSGKIKLLNMEAKRLLGDAKSLADLFGINKRDLEETSGLNLKKIIVKDSTKRFFSFKFLKEPESGEILTVGFDITDQTRANESLRKRYRALREIDRSKTEFLSISSHELRSPLTPMKAQLQMMLKNYFGKLNRKQRESLEVVLRNSNKLDKVIQDLLEVSRIGAGRLKLNVIQTDLQEELERLRVDMMHNMMEKHVNIFLETHKMPLIKVDAGRVMQVLRILANNAIKFSPSHGDVTISAAKREKDILFSVKDSGIGIEKEKQKNIFKPFYQAEETIYRKYGGIGLGLAISKGIVEALGGRIWFKSARGRGATFYFTIPLKPAREFKPIRLLK